MEISIGSGGDAAQTVTAWAALLAALLGPLAGYLAARHQSHRSVVSVNRQKWVDELREEIADFLGQVSEMEPMLKMLGKTKDEIPGLTDLITQSGVLIARIELRLNPLENDHKELLGQLKECVRIAAQGGDLYAARTEALIRAKRVLKREWQVVKAGR